MASVSSFTTKGKRVNWSKGSGRLASLGRFDTTTGRIYTKPRLRADQGVSSGGSVRVTNPAGSVLRTQKTASLGMGGVGSKPRYK